MFSCDIYFVTDGLNFKFYLEFLKCSNIWFGLLLHQGMVVMSSRITHTQSSNIHLLAHILDTGILIFSSSALFSCATASCKASHPSLGDNHQSTEGRSERTQGQAKIATWNSIMYICTRSLHSFIFHALSRSLHCHSSVAQSHLHTIHHSYKSKYIYEGTTSIKYNHTS